MYGYAGGAVPAISSTPAAALSGTAVASITESNIVAGGKTIVITLSGAIWKPA